jgi:hypothetical protein
VYSRDAMLRSADLQRGSVAMPNSLACASRAFSKSIAIAAVLTRFWGTIVARLTLGTNGGLIGRGMSVQHGESRFLQNSQTAV